MEWILVLSFWRAGAVVIPSRYASRDDCIAAIAQVYASDRDKPTTYCVPTLPRQGAAP